MLFCGLMLAVFVTNLMASGVLYFSGVAQDMSRNPSASPFCDDDVLVDKYVMASVALPAEATVCSDEPLWGGPSLDAAAGTCTAAPPSVAPTPAVVAAAAAATAASAASSAASASANSTAVLWWNTAEPSAVLLSAWLVSYVPVVLLGMALYVACRALRRRVMGLAASAAAASAGSEVSRPADMLVRWVGSDVHDLHVEARVGEDQEEAAWRRAWQRDRREWQQLLSLTRCINSKARVCAVEGVTTTSYNVVCAHACSTTCEQNYAAHVLLLQSRTLDTGLRMVEQGAVEALLNILRKREQKQDETQEYALRTLGNLTCMFQRSPVWFDLSFAPWPHTRVPVAVNMRPLPGKEHTVAPGDTWSSIALRYSVSVTDLLTWNRQPASADASAHPGMETTRLSPRKLIAHKCQDAGGIEVLLDLWRDSGLPQTKVPPPPTPAAAPLGPSGWASYHRSHTTCCSSCASTC